MKKYGIITHYDVHNHGALLQLYALKQVLKSFNISASALQFEKSYDFMGNDLKVKYDISIKSIGVYLKYLKEKGICQFIYNYKKRQILNTFRSNAELIGDYYTKSEQLDGVVVGSDEVFALHTGPTPVFFGHALKSNKVFAYGGCFGPTTLDDIENLHCRTFVASGLNSMCGLGMRDLNSVNIGKQLTDIEPELVCDPVILYGFKEELKGKNRPMSDKYLIIYSYDNYLNKPNEVDSIKLYAKKNKLKVVSPGFLHSWADKSVNCNPLELLNWFQHAECVITNTFHGCVMSIITEREMAVKLRDNSNKLLNLMEEYEITHRQIDESMKLDDVFSNEIDWQSTNKQILERRNNSIGYLQKMIEK